MSRYLQLFISITCLSPFIQAQTVSQSSAIQWTTKGVFGLPEDVQQNWQIELVNKSASDHVYAIPKEEILKEKSRLAQLRLANHGLAKNESPNRSDLIPIIGANFEGNIQGSSVPPDNSMAVSKNGYIVSAINSNIIFTTSLGKLSFTQNLSDFFTFLGLGSSVYDPRIIYDVEMNRFIVLALHGNTAATSKIYVAFSKSENPAAGWYYYSFDGNPLDDQQWFDYPNVGLTQQCLYFTGLMRNTEGLWQYSIVYQVDKKKCFSGEAAQWLYFADPKNADGSQGFNLVPAHSAWNTLPESKMYFISNVAQGGDKYNLFSIEGSVGQSQQLQAIQLTGPQTALAPDGDQKGTSDVLNTFDSRIWNAMELNGIIHFGGHVNSPANTSALFYGRLDLSNFKVSASLLYDAEADYGFPSIAAFGNDHTSDQVLINFLKTSENFHPQQVAVMCSGSGEVFDWGKEVVTKEGVGFIDALQDNRERWGDYTTVCRRYWQADPEIWITGCYGRGTYGTWLAQYFADSTKSFVDFGADKISTNPNIICKYGAKLPEGYSLIQWTFENGIPATSSSESPEVKYAELGAYDVSIEVRDAGGVIKQFTKEDYMAVLKPIIAPIANFSANKDTIFQGESVQFKDESTNEPFDYSWTFQNGTPNASKEINPLVTYNKKGSHFVNLTVKNAAGSDNETKQKYITVLEIQPPVAAFTADKLNATVNEEISFFDMSTNQPSSWQWTFTGGSPETSTEQHPKVSYASEGSYDVSLTVTNAGGSNTFTASNYITIGSSSTSDQKLWSQIKIHPNPVNDEKLTLSFDLAVSQEIQFSILDRDGKLVKHLMHHRVKQGRNELVFNSEYLNRGIYFLEMKTNEERKVVGFVKM